MVLAHSPHQMHVYAMLMQSGMIWERMFDMLQCIPARADTVNSLPQAMPPSAVLAAATRDVNTVLFLNPFILPKRQQDC